ncbi:unnamed protein product [Dibothriocephalus latus]|uniref:Tc1-like transposase DDE domain-containing protein n=1 Tax=Dibothriocephalus latus TaxID=60516 RepID=A0A3P7LI70_DIBLA|nr:unnamed protein product [Dibothriocephalus latus]
MLRIIFMQDRATAHMALETQRLPPENVPHLWRKDMGPANDPKLNPIENLWFILENILEEKLSVPATVAGLERSLLDTWRKIALETPRISFIRYQLEYKLS